MADVDMKILDVPGEATGATLTEEQRAYHEAAHAVLAHRIGGGIEERGIDLEHRSSKGAHGGASCYHFNDDPGADSKVRRLLFQCNLVVICAGPACDAKLLGQSLEKSLRDQWSDHSNLVAFLSNSPLIDRSAVDQGKGEMAYLLYSALDGAAAELERPEVWSEVEAVAKAVIDAGGKLAGPAIVAVIAGVKSGGPSAKPQGT